MTHPMSSAGAPPRGSRPTSISLHEEVRRIISHIFGVAPEKVVSSAALVADLRATSRDFVELVMAIEEAFDIEISDDAASTVVTVDDLEALIRRRQAAEHKASLTD